MPVFLIRHTTSYRYGRPVRFGDHWIMLRPRESSDQKLIEVRLDISPLPASLGRVEDVFGNHVERARFQGAAEELRFDSTVLVDCSVEDPTQRGDDEQARSYPVPYDANERPDLVGFLRRDFPDPERTVDKWVGQFVPKQRRDSLDLLADVTNGIRRGLAYSRREHKGVQSPSETLRLGTGSCRDFAVLMMDVVRSLGMAARFVSGYLHIPKERDEMGVEGGSTHAWVQVYLPVAGWVDFDPTSGIIGNSDLIRVAVAREPCQAIPLHGTWFGHASDSLGMTVNVRVTTWPGDAGASEGVAPASERRLLTPCS